MMKDSEKIKMEINIGGQLLELTVPFQDQVSVRRVEREMSRLFATWRKEFPQKTEKQLLAMMAYQYGSFYHQLTEKYRQAADLAEECDRLLDAADA